MSVHALSLSNFRSYTQQVFQFHPLMTVIVGENASGKTSVLEALHLLSTGKSFRASKIEEMVSFGSELARLQARVTDLEELEVMLTRGLVQGRRAPSTLFSLNGAKKRKKDVIGQLLTTTFRPEDMRLVEGSPARRRQFLDTPLSLVSSSYAYSLKTYDEALRKRNRLLLKIREGEMSRQVLKYWDLQLIKHGQIIQELRRQFVFFFQNVDFQVPFYLEYDWSEMSESRLQKYAQAEIGAGHTLVGPHKDDLIVRIRLDAKKNPEPVDVAVYGSRGQQRLAVLWLKLGESLFVRERTDQAPVILLDDILSELDEEHRRLVLELFKSNQVILTTTEQHLVQEILAVQPQLDTIQL